MGKHELINSFIRGDIDRRQFVSRLTMLGVSAGAAVAYASSLTPSAAAAPAGSTNGFRTRFQADDDYGTAIVISVIEALDVTLDAVQSLVLSVFESLEQFSAGDFPDGVYDILQTMFDQQQQHLDALQALFAENAGGTLGQSRSRAAQASEISSPEDFLTTLSENFDDITALYAAVVPAVPDGGVRQTFMEISSVASRHAALAGSFAARNPLPSAFQEPALEAGL